MAGEKDKIFSSKVKYSGLFNFGDFYKFCYEWLTQECELDVIEEQYVEKIKGNKKDIEFAWEGTKKVSDYFKYVVKVEYRIIGMEEVEVIQDKLKKKFDKAVSVEVKIGSTIVKDWQGNFETNAFKKFLRGIYEK